MKKQLLLMASFLFCLGGQLVAQETFPYNGVKDSREGLYAFVNATIYTAYDQKIENGTLIIRDGKIEAVGTRIRVPDNAIVIDAQDKYIYPSFVEIYGNYGMPEPKSVGEKPRRQPQMLSNKKGAYSWNEALKPEFNTADHFKVAGKKAKEWRDLGFGTMLSHQIDGISRGTSALVLLGEEKEHRTIIKEEGAHHLSFRKGKSTQNYPSSLMGAIALLRQTYYDGQWYAAQGHSKETNISLEAWNGVQQLPQIFEVGNWMEALRAQKIAKEFGKTYIFKGGGDEYQRIDALKGTNSAFIIPVNFPAAYDVEDPYDALQATLADMKHWELAPTNPAHLAKNGIDFALTTHGLKKKSTFLGNVRKAIKHGLSEEDALKALTHTPARLIKADDQIGSLTSGKWANFIITSGNIFDKKTKIHHNWIRGKAFVIKGLEKPNLYGVYNLKAGPKTYRLHVKESKDKTKMVIEVNDSTDYNVKYTYKNGLISLIFPPEKTSKDKIRLSGAVTNSGWMGGGSLPDGQWVSWSVTPTRAIPDKDKENKKDKDGKGEETPTLGKVTYPFVAFGNETAPTAKTYLIQNATVWTNEAEGIMRQADVLVRNGKIEKIGQNLQDRSATIINGEGKHLTSGIIDEHSHIAISRGVNEGTQASTAEVSIADVVNSEDINIYRQLSGGVTVSQLLHGSANPIGGQSAIVKLRWGKTPEEMKFVGADPFIKFALGENVKQSNWGDNNRTRFPQTRMGVEQVFENYFSLAREYGEQKRSGKPYRKDLDLEALLEILESKRFITCHSYQQGEINMLMKVAERHGFRVNTFTHILEGYKVADKMVKHGVGGSTFSDWWAYKYEVIDAIPHNGPIMQRAGVVTAYNSDDAEMARRLNQEAAKAVMYGDLSEEEAWKFVTLNPAKLLHIDNKVGSIKVGKDADLVLWSDHPMSVYAKAEITLIDGVKYFDRAEDLKKREEVRKEQERLIQKMLKEKARGKKTQGVKGKHQHLYHCDDIHDEMH